MPNLTLTVTDDQVKRIRLALAARYKGTALEKKPMEEQAQDFLFNMCQDMVLGYERAEAAKTAASTIADL